MSQTWRSNSLNEELWESMFYTTYTTVRTAVMTPILVVFIFTVLRLAGARTLTQATLFNKIVMVAVGTLVGSVALPPNSPLTSVVIATLVIVGVTLLFDAAYALGWIPGALLHPKPVLMCANGQILHSNLRRCLLAPEKLHSELRSKSHINLADVFAVVLEPTGSFAVITNDAANKSDLSLLQGVEGYDKYLKRDAHVLNGEAAAPAGAEATQTAVTMTVPVQQTGVHH